MFGAQLSEHRSRTQSHAVAEMFRCILQVVVVFVVIIIIKGSRRLTQILNNSSALLHVHLNIAFIYPRSPPLHLVPRLRIGGAIPLLRLHAFKAWTGITLPFFILPRVIHISAANNTNTKIQVSKAVQT